MNLKVILGLLIYFFLGCNQEVEILTEEKIVSIYENGNQKDTQVYHVYNYHKVLIKKIKYFESGAVNLEQKVNEDGEANGITTQFYENGIMQVSGNYYDGRKDGIFYWYDEDGKPTQIQDFNNGVMNFDSSQM
jgi:antitoxin component YwqK of YwqJK toxin-antitoxin module